MYVPIFFIDSWIYLIKDLQSLVFHDRTLYGTTYSMEQKEVSMFALHPYQTLMQTGNSTLLI